MAMFKFLKDKIKETVNKFSKKAEEEAQEVNEESLSPDEIEVIAKEKLESQEGGSDNSSSSDSFKSVDDLIPSADVDKKSKSKEKIYSAVESDEKDFVDLKESSKEDDFVDEKEEVKLDDSKEESDFKEPVDSVVLKENSVDHSSQKKVDDNLEKELSDDNFDVDETIDVDESIDVDVVKETDDSKDVVASIPKIVNAEVNIIQEKKESEKKIADKEESNSKDDSKELEDVEVDPLVEEVLEKNRSFEEAQQQAANPPDIASDKTESISQEENEDIAFVDKEITKEEIVDDDVEDSSAVENIIAVDTQDITDNSTEDESTSKKGFFKRIFGKKDSVEKESDDKDVSENIEITNESIKLDTTELPIEKETSIKEIQEDEVKPVDFDSSQSAAKPAVHKDLLADDIDDSTKKKKGFFGKIKERVVKFQLTDDAFEELFWEFELALLEGNVASEVIEKIKSDLKVRLTNENISRKEVSDIIFETLKNSLDEILSVPSFDLISRINNHKTDSLSTDSSHRPFVICIVGVNGSGKTTTLAKIINLLQKNNLSLVVAAADTFRAAAIQQLEEHTNKLGVKLIKHDYNADPAAVAFDAIKHANAKNLDVVLIDTAGRLQSNSNLMDELKKLIRVNKPDLSIFVGESITGNDCVEQAVSFNDAVGIDGIILSKADVDDKGGAAISVSYVTKKPILYLGTGQTYDDLKPFNKADILETLGL